MNQLTRVVSTPVGTFAVLALAAYLEVQGDACFQAGLCRASGMRRLSWFLAGAAVLVCYSLLLNFSNVDFGKLVGVYVVLFFLITQIIAKPQFHQSPTKPIYLGGVFIIVGGLIMTLWKP